MIIGIMSDSHDNLDAIERALAVFRDSNTDMVIHLGDIISPFALAKILEFPAKIFIVLGNNDGDIYQLRELAHKAGAYIRPHMYITTISNKKFLLMHGMGNIEQTLQIVESIANSNRFDVILYGHTHRVDTRVIGRTLIINPGEVCGYLSNRKTVVTLDTETMSYRVIDL